MIKLMYHELEVSMITEMYQNNYVIGFVHYTYYIVTIGLVIKDFCSTLDITTIAAPITTTTTAAAANEVDMICENIAMIRNVQSLNSLVINTIWTERTCGSVHISTKGKTALSMVF